MKNILLSFILISLFSACSRTPLPTTDSFSKIYSEENLPGTFFTVNTEQDTVLKGKAGTKIFIPKNTFTDKKGNLISGNVLIEMKEAISNAEMVLGNLTTTSDGELLQSGGMIYVNASYNDEEIRIAENQSIGISVPAENKIDGMKIYSAIKENGKLNWIDPQERFIESEAGEAEIDNDTIPATIQSASHATAFSRSERYISQLIPPAKPLLIEPERDTILLLDFDPDEFPEMAQYKNVKFRLRNNPNYNPSESEKIWTNVELEKTKEEGIYLIKLTNTAGGNNISASYRVSPGFSGDDYKDAMNIYNKMFSQYETAKKQIAKDKLEAARIAEVEKQKAIKEEKLRSIAAERKRIADSTKAIQRNSRTTTITTKLSNAPASIRIQFMDDAVLAYNYVISQLGWSNIDKLYNDPRMQASRITAKVSEYDTYESLYMTMLINNKKVFFSGARGTSENMIVGPETGIAKLPIGEEATIIVTGFRNNTTFISIQKITINENIELNLQLKKIIPEDLQSFIHKNI